jgi:hypothetical protein
MDQAIEELMLQKKIDQEWFDNNYLNAKRRQRLEREESPKYECRIRNKLECSAANAQTGASASRLRTSFGPGLVLVRLFPPPKLDRVLELGRNGWLHFDTLRGISQAAGSPASQGDTRNEVLLWLRERASPVSLEGGFCLRAARGALGGFASAPATWPPSAGSSTR